MPANQPPVYSVDSAESVRYRAELEAYCKSNIWAEKGKPLCRYYDACKGSINPEKQNFGFGQLSHIGKNYALKRNGKDFRVAIPGAETGEPTPYVSVEDRTARITDHVPENGHMRGTLIALQLLFQVPCQKENLTMQIGGHNATIYSAFSLPNFLLCSVTDTQNNALGNRTDNANTPTTRKNCAKHYHETLRILKPNIVIALGPRARSYFKEYHQIKLDPNACEIHECEIEGHSFLLLPLHHPARIWGHWGYKKVNQIEEYVKPRIEKLLARFDNQ